MKCHKCKEDIDFELTPDEDKDIQKQLDEANVVMVCYKCYEPMEGLGSRLIQDFK